jgi:hypothetical protein
MHTSRRAMLIARPATIALPGAAPAAVIAAVLAALVLMPMGALAGRADREAPALVPVLDQVDRTVTLGVSTPYGYEVKKLKRFGAKLGGRLPAIWTIWSRWGDPTTKAFPTTVVKQVNRLGVTPMIWWEPFKPGSAHKPWFPRFANTVAGKHDAYIRRWARRAKEFGRTVLVRYAPETNGGYHAWAKGRFDNSAENYIAAWRHVWEIFRKQGATNVKFVWSVSRQSCAGGCNPYTEFYPGDQYVDYASFSAFNWGAQKDNWVSMLQGFTRVTNLISNISGRPIMAVESASNGEGGDKAAWIREGYPAVYAGLPAIMAIVYLNADLRSVGHPDWRIASPPAAMTAYAEVAAMPEFSGRLKKRSGGTIQDALNAAPTARRR